MATELDRLMQALAARYSIEAETHKSGLANVYLARDEQLGRAVTIKALRPEAGDVGRAFFRRECNLLRRLDHPNIVQVVDDGEVAGVYYLVTPYLDGETLRDRLCREQVLPIEDALHIACDVADSLSHAHSRGVVLREITPGAIALVSGRAVVSDFSVAYSPEVGDHLVEDGMLVGAPFYMSPELVSGEFEVDGRSDIYSLGAVLYGMLIGEPPFNGPTAAEVIRKCILEAPPSLTLVRPEVTDRLSTTVEKALAKKPHERYQTAHDFGDALRECLEEMNEPPPKPWWRRLWRN